MAPPSLIFVVRHGNRLDAADKQWHISSPTPYDTPLTYSGWVQSRTVGVRIADILRERAREHDASQSDPPTKKKRFRIVIHTSPFLRCLQTSIAISAGISSRPSVLAVARRNLSATQIAALAAGPDGIDPSATSSSKTRRTACVGRKTVLRIDAFLGEWLTPGYFELITPPPSSVMMLASAKATLLKAEDYGKYPHFQQRVHANSAVQLPTLGQLWGGGSGLKSSPAAVSPVAGNEDAPAPSALESLDGIERSLPSISRRASNVSDVSQASRGSDPFSTGAAEIGAYDPPVPAFSLHKNAPIPPGYVNHAKDNCVVVDYQWDSMRAPYDWGDGGELPEDWPDMHRRFRKGLQSMVDWYSASEDPATAVTTEYIKPGANGQVRLSDAAEAEDYEEETVVVIVSHGAGCNAMIGAISHQPVLVDVPVSSLTIAALKKPGALAASGGTPIHQVYAIKMSASTDHLRSTTSTPSSSRSASIANATGLGGRSYNSMAAAASQTNGANPDGHISRSASISTSPGSLGSLRRGLQNPPPPRHAWSFSGASGGAGANQASFTPSGLSRTPSIGLWSPVVAKQQQQDEECIEDDEDYERLINGEKREENEQQQPLGNAPASASSVAAAAAPAAVEGGTPGNAFLPLTDMDGAAADGAGAAHKRRWTVNERS